MDEFIEDGKLIEVLGVNVSNEVCIDEGSFFG